MTVRVMLLVLGSNYALAGIYEREAEPGGRGGKGASKIAVLVRADLVELPKANEEAAK